MGKGETVLAFDALHNDMGLGPLPRWVPLTDLAALVEKTIKCLRKNFYNNNFFKKLSKEAFLHIPGLKIGQRGYLHAWTVVPDDSLDSECWESGAPPLFTCTHTHAHRGTQALGRLP